MIRKILVQDIVSKRSAKSGKESKDTKDTIETEGRSPSARERDFLIERLSRKHTVETPVKAAPRASAKSTRTSPRKNKTSIFGNKWLWFGAPIVIVVGIILALQFFSGAIVTVTPKHLTVSTSTNLIASNATTTTGVAYQVITLSSTESSIVPANGVVATKPAKATGTIIVFNKFSATAQTLIKNTRFETPDGLIFRSTASVKVPGMDKKGNPGSVAVNVIADQVGTKYNVGLTDFTVPGFKTDVNRFTKIFGRSKTAMEGGADSSAIGIEASIRQNAVNDIQNRLKDSLLKQVQAEKSADSVIFDGATKISFQNLPDAAGNDPQHATISQKGTISALVFDKKAIGKILLSDAISKVGNNAQVHGIEGLNFLSDVASTTLLWQMKPFHFSLSGTMDVTGVVDADKLAKDIAGIQRESLPGVMARYPTVEKVSVVIKPFWKGKFPTDTKNIKIEIAK